MKSNEFEGKKVLVIHREQNSVGHCVGTLKGKDNHYLFFDTNENSVAIPHSSVIKLKLFKGEQNEQ